MIRNQLNVTVLIALAALAGPALAMPVEYTAGHADLGVGYEDGELHLHWHFGNGAVLDGVAVAGDAEYEPMEAYLRLPDSLAYDLTPTQAAGLAFTGAVADADNDSDDIWILPQNASSGVPFLGWGTEELNPGNWQGPLTYEVAAVRGPGELSIWQSGAFGSPSVWYNSYDNTAGDTFTLATGSHDHANLGFTAPGVYEVDLAVTGTHAADGQVFGSGTFRFAVGDDTVIPEPAALILLTMGGLAALGRRPTRFTAA